MNRRRFICGSAAAFLQAARGNSGSPLILRPDSFQHHVTFFNGMVKEDVVNHIPDSEAWSWMAKNIPLFTCPDPAVEQVYYYRWWAFRKHIKQTPAGFIITEFLKRV